MYTSNYVSRKWHCTKNEVFQLKISSVMWPNPQFPVDFVTFTKEILNGKLHFLCSDNISINDLILLFEKTDIFIFVDDNTIYKTNPNLSVELNSLDRSLTGVINWLKVNSLIADPAKTIIYGFRCKERFRI